MTLAWPGTVHLICEWHFIKNVKEQLKGKLGDAWKASKRVLCRKTQFQRPSTSTTQFVTVGDK